MLVTARFYFSAHNRNQPELRDLRNSFEQPKTWDTSWNLGNGNQRSCVPMSVFLPKVAKTSTTSLKRQEDPKWPAVILGPGQEASLIERPPKNHETLRIGVFPRNHQQDHWTDPLTWVYNSSSNLLRGPLGKVPFNFWWVLKSLTQNLGASCSCF